MELKDKYIFRPYSPLFPKLFASEKERLQNSLGEDIRIEHVGSTAVPGLGGKGVIDILAVGPKENWGHISEELEKLGYEYKKKDEEREKERLFFMATLPDPDIKTRIYHIHLSYPESPEVLRMIKFRDYLRNHPKEAEEYSQIKKMAADEAQTKTTKDEMRDTYGKIKENFIKKILVSCAL